MSGIFNTSDGVFGNYQLGAVDSNSKPMTPEESEAATKAALDTANEVIATMGFLGKTLGPTIKKSIKSAGPMLIPVIRKLPMPSSLRNKILSAARDGAASARANKAAKQSMSQLRKRSSNRSSGSSSSSDGMNAGMIAVAGVSVIGIGFLLSRKKGK